jgi:monovalent cation:H+ antiporter, CPA1 family
MGFFETASILLTLAALFSYVNCRFIRLPTTIGVMLMSLGVSLVIILLGRFGHPFRAQAAELMSGIDFNQTLLHGMLAFLLFAGSLQLELDDLGKQWDAISVLSLAGTAISTVLVGGASWFIFHHLGLGVPLIWCMLFGALISPTDPIAVLGIMQKVGAPKPLETLMSGESLFNDGVGVVIFLAVLDVVAGQNAPSWGGMLLMLSQQVIGGIVVGLAAGILIYRLLLSVDNYQVEVLLTLALAAGGYTVAEALHVSAPIAVVVAG